jgi:transcriptional regulator with XRE-family HTH domain
VAVALEPGAGRRRLRSALRRAREAKGLTQDQVAVAMDWSLSKVIRIESGAVSISTNDLRALLRIYEVTDPTITDTLIELGRVGRRRPWWAEYRDSFPSANFEKLLGLEAETSSVRHFQPITLPGLMQTEAYARSVLRDNKPRLSDSEIEDRVAVRLARQRTLLNRADPPLIDVVLDEAVLHRMAADPSTMREQLAHLCELTEQPHITVEIVPFVAGVYPFTGPFMILSFPDPDDTDVVYLETVLSERIIELAHEVAPYQAAFEGLRQKALDPSRSVALIKAAADDLG